MSLPIGIVLMNAGSTVPAKWLECNGQAVSRSTYSDLFDQIGILYGPGNGSTTFNVPDLRGRAPIGVGTGAGLTARALADASGVESVSLTAAQNGAHTHETLAYTYVGVGGSHDFAVSGGGNNAANLTGTTTSSGTGNAHTNMPPFLTLQFIIKAEN